MIPVLIQLDEETLRRLEEVAPGRSRKRSEFIRRALQRALWEEQERRTTAAYRRAPDVEPVHFDAEAWQRGAPPQPKRSQRGRPGKRK